MQKWQGGAGGKILSFGASKAKSVQSDKNKVLLEPLKELFKNWYKQKFTEFSDIITENELKIFIEIPLKKFYNEIHSGRKPHLRH